MTTIVRIQKWGKDYALKIPPTMMNKLGLAVNSRVEIKQDQGKIVLIPIRDESSLDELVAQITPDNIHGEIDPGNAVGKEAW